MMRAYIYIPDRNLPADFEKQKLKLLEPKFDGAPLQEAEFEARLTTLDGSDLECELLCSGSTCAPMVPRTHFSIQLNDARLYGHIIQ